MYPIDSTYDSAFSLLASSLLLLCVLTLAVVHALASEPALALRRRYWQGRLDRTRLARMLAKRGLAPAAYIDAGSGAEIRHALRTCRNCAHHARCDDTLAAGNATALMLTFCPNTAAIDRLMKPASGRRQVARA